MSNPISLRYYQQESIDAIFKYFQDGNTGNPLVVLPTGAGKSHVIGGTVKMVMKYPNQRILMLTHVKELVEQNYEKLIQHNPNVDAGIYCASLRKKDMCSDVIFASIQSVWKRIEEFGKFDLIIVDECHLINTSKDTMYKKLLDSCKKLNPYIKVIGFTATAFRSKSGDLTKSDESIFDEVVYEKTMLSLIQEGFLCPLVSKFTETQIDLTGVRTRGGDFVNADLERASNQEFITKAAVAESIEYGRERSSWLFFCAGIAHAEAVHQELVSQGINAECLSSKTPPAIRDRIIDDFRNGRIKALTNSDILTTGFDAPSIDMIVFLRATKSAGLYVQMAGRGVRLNEGKENCLCLDFAGNAMRHGHIDKIRPWVKSNDSKRKGEAPSKVCPECSTIVAASALRCTQDGCDHEFQFDEKPKHNAHSDDSAIMSTETVIQTKEVGRVFFNLHYKNGSDPSISIPTLKVSYMCGLSSIYNEWLTIFHDGRAGARGSRWWSRFVDQEFPEFNHWDTYDIKYAKIKEILENNYKKPEKIVINKSGKYPSIVNYITDENNI